MQILTQQQRLNEIVVSKKPTYCIELLKKAVDQKIVSDECATKKIENLNNFIETIAQNNSNKFAINVNPKIVISNYYNILTAYLGSYSNWEAYELIMNNTAAELVKKAEERYNNINVTLMAKLEKQSIPNGMYPVLRVIKNMYENTVKQYLQKDLETLQVELFDAFLVFPERENSIEYFRECITNFSIEVSIIKKNFPDESIREIRRNLSLAYDESKKKKLEQIETEIKELKMQKEKEISKIRQRYEMYQKKQKELDNLLDVLSEEEIESEKGREILSRYDFDLLEEERRANRIIKSINEDFEKKLSKLEQQKDNLTTAKVSSKKVGPNMLTEILNEWFLYLYSVSENVEYSNLTSFAKQNFVNTLDKEWIKIQISKLQLTDKEMKYLKKGLGV